MEIKILGTDCPRCKGLYETTERAIAELGLDATLAKDQDILKIIEYKTLGLPALVVDEKVVSAGVGLSLGEVKKLLSNKIG